MHTIISGHFPPVTLLKMKITRSNIFWTFSIAWKGEKKAIFFFTLIVVLTAFDKLKHATL